ncbi:MAG: hypothetical protein MUO40_06580 [Anaerolineaceae bacterium]|nr:hypothetical protein [Anaerolineaceae bacterium]
MKLLKLLDVRGTKYAFLGLSVVANIAWGLIFFSGIDWAMANYPDLVTGLDVTMMLGIFLGSLVIAFTMTSIAKDGCGVTYGVYGGIAGLILVVILLRQSGFLLPALVGLMAILGGFNGGSLGEGYRRARKKR